MESSQVRMNLTIKYMDFLSFNAGEVENVNTLDRPQPYYSVPDRCKRDQELTRIRRNKAIREKSIGGVTTTDDGISL